jgi:hypothetical protein
MKGGNSNHKEVPIMAKKLFLLILIVSFFTLNPILSQHAIAKTTAADTNMTLLGRLPVGTCKAAVPFGAQYAIIGSGRGVRILDISDKQHPLMIAEVAMDGQVSDIAIDGSYAYVVTNGNGYYVSEDFTGGLTIIDLSNPAQPQVQSFYDAGALCQAVAVTGSYAYVASGSDVLVLNVSNVQQPSKVGSVYAGEAPHGLFTNGQYLYVAAQSSGLKIYGLNDPAHPALLGTFSVFAEKVFVQDTLAFVTRQYSGLSIVSVHDPAAPFLLSEIGGVSGTDNFSGVTVDGHYLYVSGTGTNGDGSPMLKIYDISNPRSPGLVGSYYDNTAINNSNIGERVALAGNYALMAATYGMRIVDISAPSNPRQVSQYETDISKGDVQVVGNLAYYVFDMVNYAMTGLQIIDVSDPAHLRERGYLYLHPRANADVRVSVSGNYAYVAQNAPSQDSACGIHVINISDADHPVETAFFHLSKMNNPIAAADPYLYVVTTSPDTIRILDISDPAALRIVGSYGVDTWQYGFPRSFFVTDKYLYVGTSTGLLILDRQNGALLTTAGFYALENYYYNADGVTVEGNTAYVATASGLVAVDVSDVHNPQRRAFVSGYYLDVEVIGSDVYVAANYLGVKLFNWLNDSTLTQDGFYNNNNYGALRLATDGNYLYAAYEGLMIFRKGSATAIGEQPQPVARTFELYQNYPNPFNPTTEIRYFLPQTGNVNLSVYNVLGKKVKTLVDGVQAAGLHGVRFDGRNLASGVYFYRLTINGRLSAVRKMMLLR